MAVTEVVVKIL